MSWFPVDDAFHSHPKMRRAGLESIGLWTVSGSFCMAYLTDGFVPEWFVKEKPKGVALANKLVAAGLWRTGGNNNGEKGWWFHDWKPECTKAEIEKAREKSRLRKRKSREQRADSAGHVTRDGTCDDHVPSHDCLGPTQPNPTQPINHLVDSRGRVTKATREPPPLRCPKHINETGAVPSCRACGDARKALEQWSTDRDADARSEATERRRAIDACGMCDGQGMRDVGRGAARCDHRPAVMRNA
jgi:hypothetical protein